MFEGSTNTKFQHLGDVVELQRGSSPRPISDWITSDLNGVNWIKIGDATASDKYITTCKEKIKPEGVKHSRLVREGDFLLSNSMSFGRPYILKTSGCIHDGWLLIRDVGGIFHQDYLYALLSSSGVAAQFAKLASGAVVKNLNIDAVAKVQVLVPDLKDQKDFSRKIQFIESCKLKQLSFLHSARTLQQSLLSVLYEK